MECIIFFKKQTEFYHWLEQNPEATELWVGYYKKNADRESITWSDSVDVALCFGWIDGIRKSINEDSYKIRFTPRKVNSVWSAVNVKKVETLIPLGKMKPAGLYVFNKRSDKKGYSSQDRNVPLATEYEEILQANNKAWNFFNNLAPSYKRDSIWWVMSAKKKETQLTRLSILITSLEEGQKIPSLRKK
ncbi:YdeI/OmpD-associated family protein [Pseudocolwellia sp. AS88]|uniref:YdeI/OmpD-associated family protein n=1 Tax=Pseudocolwellia sp. AS88 TaxID=3063958 RepID=UPI0026EEE640|nr:YdeI/OmpD-associated family protein [Pseudocolwellia sp. AS88]MDO7085672.1 YdeI/OmpD-associated family protein [Pseudocolwellia sp. AS88]